jgi:dCMP deaminase
MIPMAPRINIDDYFMEIAEVVAKRSTCIRDQVGAVLVKDKYIISTGYNGAPRGMEHCLDIGCLRMKNNIPHGKEYENCRSVHAEQNTIIQAATHGVDTTGATLYTMRLPCYICAKMIVNAGIRRVVYGKIAEPDDKALGVFKEGGVEVVRHKPAQTS